MYVIYMLYIYAPTSFLTNSRGNNVKELEEFMSANNATWSNFIKDHKDEFYKYTRCNSLLNLYNDCLAEEPMYIPSFDKTQFT